MLDRELQYSSISHFFYTDSKVVLGYICNSTEPVKTANDNFIQLVVSVYSDEEDQESSIVSVTGLIDRFHKKG